MPRPRKAINEGQLIKLAALGATHDEIADFFGIDRSTVERRFARAIERGRAQRKLKLRRLQWRAAEKGNIAMLIWLGKNMLGQSDNPKDPDVEKKVIEFIVHHPDEILKVPCPCRGERKGDGLDCEVCLGTGVKEIRYRGRDAKDGDSDEVYEPSDLDRKRVN